MKKGMYRITDRITYGAWDGKSKVKTLTINGNGAVIDGQYSKQFLVVFPKYTVNVNNLTIKNTKTPKGTKSVENGSSAILGWGKSNINIKNCKFINNVGAEKGGAVTARGKVTIKNCEFTGGAAYWGSAVYAKGSDNGESYGTKVTIENCTFNKITVPNNFNNHINDRMGALYFCDGGGVTIKKCKFTNIQGRVIHVYKVAAIIDGNEFRYNKIQDTRNGAIVDLRIIRGGVIDSYESSTTIKNNKFYSTNVQKAGSSSGVNGGILYHEIGKLTITNNYFANVASANSEKENGGSLYIRNTSATIKDNVFENSFTGSHIRGGSVYGNLATLTLEDNEFNNKVKTSNLRGNAIMGDDTSKLNIIGNDFNSQVTGQKSTAWVGKATVVKKTATKTSVSSIKAKVGQTIKITAKVTSSGKKVSVGNVQFLLNGVSKGYKKLSNGVATLSYKIPKSSKTKVKILAVYKATAKFKKSSGTGTLLVSKK